MENDSDGAAREAAGEAVVSPYLRRPLRTLQEALRHRATAPVLRLLPDRVPGHGARPRINPRLTDEP